MHTLFASVFYIAGLISVILFVTWIFLRIRKGKNHYLNRSLLFLVIAIIAFFTAGFFPR